MQFYSLEFQAFRTLLKELIRIEESENTFDSTWNINDTLDEIYPMFHKINYHTTHMNKDWGSDLVQLPR